MGYRHLTSDELDALCDEYEVLANLRDAGRGLHRPRHRSRCYPDKCLSALYFFRDGRRDLKMVHGTDFYDAQRAYHNTARVLAGLKPYK